MIRNSVCKVTVFLIKKTFTHKAPQFLSVLISSNAFGLIYVIYSFHIAYK